MREVGWLVVGRVFRVALYTTEVNKERGRERKKRYPQFSD